jgi:riboflavin biosynthesis pyrimidine reductase
VTVVASTPYSSVHDVDALGDDALRDLLAYRAGGSRPWLRANFIASIDGAVTFDGSGRKLGTPTDRRVFTRLREVADVVLVGATTAAAKPYADMSLSSDAHAWRLSHGLAAGLPIAVVSGSGAIPQQLLENSSVPPVLLVSTEAGPRLRRALDGSGARIVELAGVPISPAAIRQALAAVGLNRVLVEGGPTLFSQFVSQDAIDELCLTTSPRMVAGPARRIAASDRHAEVCMERRRVFLGGDGTVIVQWVRC